MDVKWGLTSDTALSGFLDLPNTSYQYGLSSWQFGDSLSLRLSPPIEWDGTGNLVLEFALDGVTSQTDGIQDGWVPVTGGVAKAWIAEGHDGEVDFTAPDRVEVDVTDLQGLSIADHHRVLGLRRPRRPAAKRHLVRRHQRPKPACGQRAPAVEQRARVLGLWI